MNRGRSDASPRRHRRRSGQRCPGALPDFGSVGESGLAVQRRAGGPRSARLRYRNGKNCRGPLEDRSAAQGSALQGSHLGEEPPAAAPLLQTYLASCKALENSIDGSRNWRDRERAKLLVEIITSSIAPSNFLATNPAALRRAREATRSSSLVHGALNFLHDLRHNGGMPSQVDKSAFTVGKNIAVTPGAVVFRNEVLEILQYKPQTARVPPAVRCC